jgi:hypothetical protein
LRGKEPLPVRRFGPRQARAQEETPYCCCAYTLRLRVPTHRNVVLGYSRSLDQGEPKTFCTKLTGPRAGPTRSGPHGSRTLRLLVNDQPGFPVWRLSLSVPWVEWRLDKAQ